MAQQFLQGADIISGFRQMCRKTVPEAVRGRAFADAGGPHCGREFAADRGFVGVVSAERSRSGLGREFRGGEHILSVPEGRGFGRFSEESEGQIDTAIAGGEMREEGVDLRGGHLGRVAFVVEEDEAFAPVVIAVLGAVREAPNSAGRAQPIKQLGLLLDCRRWRRGDHLSDDNLTAKWKSNELRGEF